MLGRTGHLDVVCKTSKGSKFVCMVLKLFLHFIYRLVLQMCSRSVDGNFR